MKTLQKIMSLAVAFSMLAVIMPASIAMATGEHYKASHSVDKETAKAGEVLTYTAKVVNDGSTDIEKVIVGANISSHVDLIAGSTKATKYGQAVSIPDSWVKNYDFYDLRKGETLVIVYQAKVKSEVINNTRMETTAVFSTSGLPNKVLCVATTFAKVEAVAQPHYSPSKTVDKTVAHRGDTLTYTLMLKNDGNVALNDVWFYDRIPTGTTYIANSAVMYWNSTSKQPNENWVNTGINFGKLEVGEVAKLVFKVKVNDDRANGSEIQNVGQFRTAELPNWVQCATLTKVVVESTPTPTPSKPTSTPTPTPTPTGEVLGSTPTPTPTLPPVNQLPATGPGIALIASLGSVVSALLSRKYFFNRA